MRFIENPPREQLDPLQKILSVEVGVEIKDIFGPMVTDYLAVEDSGKVVGVASISVLGEGLAEIYKLYVAPSYRGRGVGRFLLEESIGFLERAGVEEFRVSMVGDSYDFWAKSLASYVVKWYWFDVVGVFIRR